MSGDPLEPDRTGGEKAVPDRSVREIEVKVKMEERTEWREQSESQIGGEEMRSGRPVGAAGTSKGLQQKNLSILGLLKRKEWPRCDRESSWQVHQSRPCQNEKEQSRLYRAPDRTVGESQGEREPHLGEKKRDQSKSKEKKG